MLAMGGFNLLPAPAFVSVSLARPTPPLSVVNTPLRRTPARTPMPSRATTPVPVPLKQPKKTSPPPREPKLTDEWTLSMHWPVGHAWPPTEIEEVFPVGEVVAEVYG